MEPSLREAHGLRIAVEGCGHGTLNAIYASVSKACEVREWDGVDLLIIGGDFQVRCFTFGPNLKYREIGDFHAYYSGATKAPYLTIFVGGNHEASSHLWELYYGGWVAPNIYYMGAANVVRLGGVRIAGMSGIWKGYNFNKPHHERLPYNPDDIKSIYHVREIDIRKLLQLRTQVDIGISHDWPRAIEHHGNQRHLFSMKPDFEQESKDGTLGNQAATYVMDRLRPPYWFAAHMHCKFAATKTYEETEGSVVVPPTNNHNLAANEQPSDNGNPPAVAHNADEIDLDMDEDETLPAAPVPTIGEPSKNQDEISPDDDEDTTPQASIPPSSIPSELRAQLPAAFTRTALPPQRTQPGQPIPPDIKNRTVRFLALDKCLPGRKFLQLLEVQAHDAQEISTLPTPRQVQKFEYDPEWLAIIRVFAPELVVGDKNATPPRDLGEVHYRSLIEKEQKWVNENIVQKDRLDIPDNFEITAPPFYIGMPEIINEGPREYNNPQMQQFCDLQKKEEMEGQAEVKVAAEVEDAEVEIGEEEEGVKGEEEGEEGEGGIDIISFIRYPSDDLFLIVHLITYHRPFVY
ncbi:hypothetical protein B7494_g5681 [Chlorociboria aeruginascens]|nr:hypothetical protein B7494_g5681 [Chlorociboria aeruginascens]